GGLNKIEASQLIKRYDDFGILAAPEAHEDPERFANLIDREPISIGVCRILTDFQPIDRIIASLWSERLTTADNKIVYLIAALARHCIASGVRYSILQESVKGSTVVSDFVNTNIPLRLIENPRDNDYLLPYNQSISY